MSLVELVTKSAGMRIVDEDGNEETLRLLPPMTAGELAALEAELPCPVPAPLRDLLAVTRGFENGPLESVDFGGVPGGFGLEEVFAHALAVAHDGVGNYWVADLHAHSSDWAPIYFACHDPPVIAFQSDSLERFVAEVLRSANPPHESEIDTVHDYVTMDIWRRNAGAVAVSKARSSADDVVRAFAQALDDSYYIIDLRNATIGDGFSWGRYGPRTKIVRHGADPIFAYQAARSWWQRLFRRAP